MMGDPKRLLTELGDTGALERELLASIRQVEPPNGAKGVAWAALSTQIAAVAVVGAAHQTAASLATKGAPSALKLFGGKVAVGLALAGAAGGGSVLWLQVRGPDRAPSAATPARTQSPSASTEAALPPNPQPRAEAADARPAVTPLLPSPRAGAPLTRQDRLAAESALLTKARADLRRGDVDAAQRTLNRLSKSFPNGVLGQERELLRIELLAARGDSDAARRRARAFIATYPKSPHSAQLGRFADAP